MVSWGFMTPAVNPHPESDADFGGEKASQKVKWEGSIRKYLLGLVSQ